MMRMEKVTHASFFILIFFCHFGCNKFSKTKKTESDYLTWTSKWKKDTLGCMGVRTLGYSKLINENIKFKGKSEKELYSILGQPDLEKIYENDQTKYAAYFMNSRCNNGKIIDSSTICILEYKLDLKNDRVLFYDNFCLD